MAKSIEQSHGREEHQEGSVLPLRELDSWQDGFGNHDRLVWDPNDNSVHLRIIAPQTNRNKLDVEVPPDRVLDAREHPYPYAFAAERRYGQVLVGGLVEVSEQVA